VSGIRNRMNVSNGSNIGIRYIVRKPFNSYRIKNILMRINKLYVSESIFETYN